MKLAQEQINNVMSMDIKQAYDFYLVCKLENIELQQYYQQIRYGITHEFDIHDLIEGNYITRLKAKTVTISNNKIKLDEFRTEEENRTALIKKAIMDHMTEEGLFEERTENDKTMQSKN